MVAFLQLAASAVLLATSPNQSPQTTQSSSRINKYTNLLKWMDETFPNSYINPSIEIQPSPRGGFGAFATKAISEDELVFTIPREACITSTDVLNDPDCGKAFSNLIEKAGPGGFTVALAGYMAKGYLLLQEEKETKFGPYLETLPWERGINGQEHILFWSAEDVETYLDDTMCYSEALGLRAEVKFAKKVLNAIIGPSVLKARDEIDDEKPLVPFLPWTKPPAPTVTSPVMGLGRAVTGSFVVLLTRAFEDNFDSVIQGENAEKLIPLLDMLNHDNEPTVRYDTNVEDGRVEVRARRDIGIGEELFNRYREEEELNMPYHRFFTRFGFVPGITEDIRILLQERSSIFFAKRKEV